MFYYEQIRSGLHIPIMVHNAPKMTQVSMRATLLARLSQEIERVRYLKVRFPPTAPKVSSILEASEGRLASLSAKGRDGTP